MRQVPLGRSTTKFVPLPVEMTPKPNWKPFGTPNALREVPFVPTPQHVVDEMLHLAALTDKDTIYDLGCGDGRIIVSAAKTYGSKGVGVELSPDRIKSCWQNATEAAVLDKVQFLQQSFFDVDFSSATVVALYLLPWVNAILRPKLLTQLKPGSRIVAHAFAMHDWTPDRTSRLPDKRVAYLWMVPAPAGGMWSATIRLPNGRTHHADFEIEQEFQNVVMQVRIDGETLPANDATLFGDRLRFSVRSPVKPREMMTYTCRIDGDTMRCQTTNPHGAYELRARKTSSQPTRYDA